MTDCDHTKVSYVVSNDDGEQDVKVVCPICDDVDFHTVGETTEVSSDRMSPKDSEVGDTTEIDES